MANLNSGVTITPGAAAGVGATASLPIVSADGLNGIASITIGTGPSAGVLFRVGFALAILSDLDAATAALSTLYPGATNAGAGLVVPVVVVNTVAPPVPPATALFAVGVTHNAGTLTGFGVGVSGAFTAGTTYRFSWRVLT